MPFVAPRGGRLERADAWILAAIVLGAFALRVVYVLQFRASPTFDHPYLDPEIHVEWARAIAAGESYWGDQPYFRAPLYPWLLGLCFALFGDGLLLPRLLQAAMGAASCGLVFAIGRRCFGRITGAAAGALAAGLWELLYFDAELLIEPLIVFLDLLFLWLLLRAADTRRGRDFAWSGLALGASAIARPTILPFAPFACLWILLVSGVRRRATWRHAALFGLACLAPIAPVTLHNYVVGHDLVLIASQGGVNFYIGNNADSDGMRAVVPGTRADWWGGYQDAIALAQAEAGRALAPSEVSQHYFRKGLAFARSDPGAWLRLTGRKLRYFWTAFEIPNNQPIRYFADRYAPVSRVVSLGFVHGFGTIAPFALLGLVLCLRSPRRLFPLWGFVAVYSVGVIAFFVCTRFKIPVVPVLVILACAAVRWLAGAVRARRWIPAGAGALFLVPAFWIVNATPAGLTSLDFQGPLVLGSLALHRGDLDAAVEHMQEAADLRPDVALARVQLGGALLAKGDLEAEALQRRGRGEEAARVRARWFDRAEPHLRAALGTSEFRAEEVWDAASFGLGRIAASRGNEAEAIAHYQRAIAISPHYPQALHEFGVLMAKRGRPQLARQSLERALASDPGFVPARLSLAEVLEGLGLREQAAAELERALAAFPAASPEAAQLRRRIQRLRRPPEG